MQLRHENWCLWLPFTRTVTVGTLVGDSGNDGKGNASSGAADRRITVAWPPKRPGHRHPLALELSDSQR